MSEKPLPMLFIFRGAMGYDCFIGDNPVFRGLHGYHTAHDLSFFTDDMESELIDNMGEFFTVDELHSSRNKFDLLYEFFVGGADPQRGVDCRATIFLDEYGIA